MTYLLDTHCIIWFQENNPKIPEHVMQEIQNPENVIWFSQISLFEIAIKQKIGKLPLFEATIADIYQQALEDSFTFLPVKNRHIELYEKVPLLEEHRDPFDRLLIATALAEECTIITADKNFTLYSELIKVLW
ncbi:MAG: type II toxin-antitoxin system VapC family toxin [Bacteroidota bacterium]|nr:type II toxin-antitoxin system VapC family toxin [Bacteroidota bacterium]